MFFTCDSLKTITPGLLASRPFRRLSRETVAGQAGGLSLSATMAAFKNITGQKFFRLTAIRWESIKMGGQKPDVQWECRCECGNIIWAKGAHLRSGHTQSCGCFKIDTPNRVPTNVTHGWSSGPKKTSLYKVWGAIKRRCNKPQYHEYRYYGGRGISICKEWTDSFECFLKWALENGYQNGLQIDRINNNGNYCPGNCRWVTSRQNNSNRRNTVFVFLRGERLALADAATKHGFNHHNFYSRLKKTKQTPDQILDKFLSKNN